MMQFKPLSIIDSAIRGDAPRWPANENFFLLGNIAVRWNEWKNLEHGSFGSWSGVRVKEGHPERSLLIANGRIDPGASPFEAEREKRNALVRLLAYCSLIPDEEWPAAA